MKTIKYKTLKGLLNQTRQITVEGYNTSELLAYLKNRGYENIEILSRMKF